MQVAARAARTAQAVHLREQCGDDAGRGAAAGP